MSHDSDKRLVELGRALYRERLRDDDPVTQDALYHARRRALAAMPSRQAKRRWKESAWISAGALTAALMAVALVWHLQTPNQGQQPAPEAIPAIANDAAAWKEDPAMLDNLDFAVWLDVTEPGDAG